MIIQAVFQQIVVECQNKMVIQVAQGFSRVSWLIHYLLKDIQCWKEAVIQLLFNHTFREANTAADWVAKFGNTISHPLIVETCLSPEFQATIVEDVVRRSFVRKGV